MPTVETWGRKSFVKRLISINATLVVASSSVRSAVRMVANDTVDKYVKRAQL
ncbi:hypothetical protein GCM10011375_04780 [Hymenobacter qilianensis]|uniref:Uncharacterized protein n=1 Tax=Hymenobacter qilianensis TaxID=1385715 RepID=A0ACB5PM70_9BACT|nr:hypothetical protein GCM10011375_04780 [Hymenobacter qilianensis]